MEKVTKNVSDIIEEVVVGFDKADYLGVFLQYFVCIERDKIYFQYVRCRTSVYL